MAPTQRLLSLALATTTPALSIPLTHPLAPRNTSTDTIPWTDCSHKFWLPQNLECADMPMPIDWNAPTTSGTFNLSMVRLSRPANTTAERLGTLFINPGGPGGRAVVVIAEIARGWRTPAPELLEHFDLIGVDPRGVGESADFNYCDPDIYNERVSLFPKTQEDFDKLVDKNKRLGESCQSLMGDLVNHLDTISTARDLEAVRAALGEKLNWLGLSYGSMIGAQYAELFPENIRAMVFDGMVQHSQSETTNILIESTAYAAALTSFFQWASTNDASPLKGEDVEKLWYSIIEKATAAPITVIDWRGGRRDVTAEEFLINAQGALITASQTQRIAFAEALKKADEGDAAAFSSPLAGPGDYDLYPGTTIACQDWTPQTQTFEDLQAKMRMAEVFSPLNKGASQSYTVQASCYGWPAPLTNPPKKLDINTPNPILIVNALHDPSTSYAWAVGMLEEIENAVLLSREGDGHTSWMVEGANKTTEAINRYLLTGETPAHGTIFDE